VTVDVSEVAENIYMVDAQLCSIAKLGSVYLLNEEKKVLVDSGPSSSASVVLDGIRQVGVRPEDINYIIVSHIHLDHGGGAGVLLKHMPQAQVVVHHKGAKHLMAPAELLDSSIEALGAEIIAQQGEVVPIEPHRLKLVHDNDTIRLSEKQVLDFIDAPGHAPHELCIYERRNGGLFVGDALGLNLAGGRVLLQCHPPPSFNPQVCISTIERLKGLNATSVYFAHFGAANKVQETLQLAIDKLRSYHTLMAKAVEDNTLDKAAEAISAQIRAEIEPVKRLPSLYKFVDNVIVTPCIAGLLHYYRNRYKAN
jgi:glyoxylase-like metal-dependent hydrolase (beta-lactamase superfamily II)